MTGVPAAAEPLAAGLALEPPPSLELPQAAAAEPSAAAAPTAAAPCSTWRLVTCFEKTPGFSSSRVLILRPPSCCTVMTFAAAQTAYRAYATGSLRWESPLGTPRASRGTE